MENDPNPTIDPAARPSQTAPHLERYGRYFLIERIGRGGMAEVFRAVAQGVEGFRRVFVIKRIRPEKTGSTELVRMFCDEARLSALLHHPNIVQVYDFGQISGTYFLAMEYLRGKDLSGVMRALRLAKSAVSPPIAAYIAQQVATGLHYAHAVSRIDGQPIRIVHRDVTPSNIMLQRTGGVKVLDFGIAQATNFVRQVETGGGRVKGKLAYLSPEQVRLKELDGRSDVFALGVVLWEMLVGQRLFAGENEFLTMRNVLTQPVTPPSAKRPAVPPALDAIVARALERDRERRYATAQHMAEDLERYLQDSPCHSQALPRLLQDLFGEESTDHTPDLPDVGDVESGYMYGPSPTRSNQDAVMEIDAEPSTPAPDRPREARVATPAAPVSSPAVVPAAAAPPPPPPLPAARPAGGSRQRPSNRRRLVAVVASATLAGCLLWASWKGRRHTPAPAVSLAGVVATPARPSPTPSTQPHAAPSGASAAGAAAVGVALRVGPTSTTVADGPSVRVVTNRKRVAHRLSTDVTINPFK
jgi:serine/threonine-protein kinase